MWVQWYNVMQCMVAGVTEAIYAQTIAGIFFALFGGQAMVVLMTTAPLAIYTKSEYTCTV